MSEAKHYRDKLPGMITLATEAVKSADDAQVINVLYPLLKRYHLKREGKMLEDTLLDEWIEDLNQWPPDLIALACQNWRRNDRRGFAPRASGQLMASVEDIMKNRQRILSRAQTVLQILEDDEANQTDPGDMITGEQMKDLQKIVGGSDRIGYEIPKRMTDGNEAERKRELDRRKAEFLASMNQPE